MPSAPTWLLLLSISLIHVLAQPSVLAETKNNVPAKTYEEFVLADAPVAYWRFSGSGEQAANSVGQQFHAITKGEIGFSQTGPRREFYPLFGEQNTAAAFYGDTSYLRIKDPGANSPLDFTNGDAITIEAWVKPTSIGNGQHLYIIGKGRTNNRGAARENQNYALRLNGDGGSARVSFLFRSEDNSSRDDYHRWTSDIGFVPDENWHYIAATYEFGKPDSIHGYIDGKDVSGTWDMGGPTAKAPVVDDDELWIGSTLGGNSRTTFLGLIDEVAIYRQALDPGRIALRYKANLPDVLKTELADADLPQDTVLVEIHEGIPAVTNWDFTRPRPIDRYTQPTFAFVGVPKKYTEGLISDRTNPFLVCARSTCDLPAGRLQFLLRSKSAARFFIDGELVVETGFMKGNGNGHETVPELAESKQQGLYALLPEHQEQMASIDLKAGPHVVRLELIVGGKGLRAEISEACVCVRKQGDEAAESFELLTANSVDRVLVNENDWLAHADDLRRHLHDLDGQFRDASSVATDKYWAKRHALARRHMAELPRIDVPSPSPAMPIQNDIDRFIGSRLEQAGVAPADLTDEYSFLRRVSLDTVGVIPSLREIRDFLNDKSDQRRRRVIDRLLDDPRWADNWMGYWQDLLAENPGILKPKLNNSGPFRWWIYESFLDNKPLDRFVTELIMMEGSMYGGGPAGFAMATQNDVPMAAKAQILSKAFLGLEMKCARCHDAPYHSYTQESLFNVAAMLSRKTISLPESSTVPVIQGAREPAVEISLNPGDKIAPDWPFADLGSKELRHDLLRNPTDHRERLAAVITSPGNRRFAQVVVNRLWQRYFGYGIVEPVDDWEGVQPSHPQLLEFLARELASHDYDLKHVARLILNSHAYQREVQPVDSANQSLLAAQSRRRLTAEQIVDSLFTASGKKLNSEVLSLDPEGRRPITTFLNLGTPRRAWQFTSLSNERDRPALALPMAQSFVDVLLAYGWRDSRPNATSVRDESPTMLQPLTLANGIVGHRVTTLSDDNRLTQICLEELAVDQLVDRVFLQVLARPPRSDERDTISKLLAKGFDDRRTEPADTSPRRRRNRTAVSWSNHLSAEATRIKLEMQRTARAGDPPSSRLAPDWRERMEDVVWALVNSPEFVFVP